LERTILVATTNVRKGGEMVEILAAAGLPVQIKTLADFPDAPPVDETGETFMANAHLKADAAVQHTGLISVSDDGGLVIDALDGAPGVKSHRFLGENTPFSEKMDKILEMMRDVPDEKRTCRFQCAVVIALPDGRRFECMGTCEGRIAHVRCGEHGFGYDPIFFLPELRKHMAELPPEQKHKISHRGKALACAVGHLRDIFAASNPA
jgi:XTP/dITP diphosphohydrolase